MKKQWIVEYKANGNHRNVCSVVMVGRIAVELPKGYRGKRIQTPPWLQTLQIRDWSWDGCQAFHTYYDTSTQRLRFYFPYQHSKSTTCHACKKVTVKPLKHPSLDARGPNLVFYYVIIKNAHHCIKFENHCFSYTCNPIISIMLYW